MKFLSLEPFVPSGIDFAGSKQLFQELGFKINWDAGDYIGFENERCKFILQKMEDVAFANQFMLSVRVDNIDTFRAMVIEKNLVERFGIKMSRVMEQPYGKEVNIIDIAGVCWHFVQ